MVRSDGQSQRREAMVVGHTGHTWMQPFHLVAYLLQKFQGRAMVRALQGLQLSTAAASRTHAIVPPMLKTGGVESDTFFFVPSFLFLPFFAPFPSSLPSTSFLLSFLPYSLGPFSSFTFPSIEKEGRPMPFGGLYGLASPEFLQTRLNCSSSLSVSPSC